MTSDMKPPGFQDVSAAVSFQDTSGYREGEGTEQNHKWRKLFAVQTRSHNVSSSKVKPSNHLLEKDKNAGCADAKPLEINAIVLDASTQSAKVEVQGNDQLASWSSSKMHQDDKKMVFKQSSNTFESDVGLDSKIEKVKEVKAGVHEEQSEKQNKDSCSVVENSGGCEKSNPEKNHSDPNRVSISGADVKLDFDLNEVLLVDDGNQGELEKPPAHEILSPVFMPYPLPVSISSISGNLPASINVPAAAKGPFHLPPQKINFFLPHFAMKKFHKMTYLLFIFINITSTLAYCTCDPDDDESNNKPEALKFKLVGMGLVLVVGGVGFYLPILGKIVPAFRPETYIFFLLKSFSAGVILATGFMHVLHEAFLILSLPCVTESPWGEFPFVELVVMVSTLGTLLFECHSIAYQNRLADNNGGVGGRDEESGYGDLHARFRIVSKVLELGFIVHSVIIGLSLGASKSPKTIKPLVAALIFHQFFEGIGLGGCIAQANFKSRSVKIMGIIFTLTTPLAIGIGILAKNAYKENSPATLVVEGTLDAASAGILICLALVDLLSAEFMNPVIQKNLKFLLTANVSFILGVGLMTFLAKWA